MSTRIALWRAYSGCDKRWHTVPALGLQSIVAYSRHNGADIETVYCTSAQQMLDTPADLYAISSVTAAWPETIRLATTLRDRGNRVILGGPHVTCLPSSVPTGCVGVVGEGEVPFSTAINLIESDTIEWNGVLGPSERLPLQDIDYLPVYMPVGAEHIQAVATRGCPYRCWFCTASRCWGKVTRFSPSRVADALGDYFDGEPSVQETAEIPLTQQPQQRHGGAVTFQDLHFASDPEWLYKTVDEMKRRGAPNNWRVTGCSYSAKLAKREILEKLQEVGIEWVGIGIESGSPQLFHKLKPHLHMEDNVRLIKLCAEMKIRVSASFIVGIPGETVADLKATRDFIAKYTSKYFRQGGLFMYVPYPGTPGWDTLKAAGRVQDDMDFGRLRNGANPSRADVFYCNDTTPYDVTVEWRHKIAMASRC